MDAASAAPRIRRRDLLGPDEIVSFCSQISMILKAGIPLSEGISIMLEDTGSSRGHALLEQIHGELESGEMLSHALKETGRFPGYAVDMIRIGEMSGRLEDVMNSLCTYYERQENISRGIRSAVAYPLVMVGMMILVITVLVVRVMPIFGDVFRSLGSEMTGFSLSVLRFGQSVGRFAWLIVIVLAVAIVGWLLFRSTGPGRSFVDWFRSSFFVTRHLYAKIASGRFASAMSLMLTSGLDTDQALEMACNLIEHPSVHRKICDCRRYIAEGSSFPDALVKSGIFSGIHARMITVGFRTGALDTVMQNLASRYEADIDERVSGIISVLEPTIVAVLSVVVGMILLSVMLPLMGIMASIG